MKISNEMLAKALRLAGTQEGRQWFAGLNFLDVLQLQTELASINVELMEAAGALDILRYDNALAQLQAVLSYWEARPATLQRVLEHAIILRNSTLAVLVQGKVVARA